VRRGDLPAEALAVLGYAPEAEPPAVARRENPYPPNRREAPCVHRGDFLREQTCDVCSYKGTVKAIHSCDLLAGECFEGLGGFRAPAKIEPCRACDYYQPVQPRED
jgi:hypothetical protein